MTYRKDSKTTPWRKDQKNFLGNGNKYLLWTLLGGGG
jgi:hypothetical protein